MKMKTFTQLKKELKKDKKFKKAYDELEFEFKLIELLIENRLKKGMTQKELAEKVGTKQSAIARFESGEYNPTILFIQKVSHALNVKLKVSA